MKYLAAVMALVFVLLNSQSVRADAFASATAGNAEAPNGNDFQMGLDSAIAATSDTDPEFGTATADATVFGPSLSVSGFAASFVGPAWIANGSADWFDNLVFRFPVDSVTGLPENLLVELVASFTWSIDANGGYSISLQGLGAGYSTADGQTSDDFGSIAGGPAGSATVSAIGPFNLVVVDPEDPTLYRGEFGISMNLSGGAGSGDWLHGSFSTATADMSFELIDIIVHDGEGVIEDPEIDADSGENYEFEVASADFDDDADVDGRDFLLWQRGFGIASGALLGDGDSNADGDVDGNDLGVWRDQYSEPGHLARIVSVPEPTSVIAMVASVALLMMQRLVQALRLDWSLK